MRKPDSIAPPGARPSLPVIAPTSTSTPPSSSSQSTRSSANSSPEFEEPEVLSASKSRSLPSRRLTSSLMPPTKRKRVGHTLSDDGTATDDRGENETDGDDADAEFSDFRGWGNVNTRRKSAQNSSNTPDVGSTTASRKTSRDPEDGFGRRHSMAV